MKYFCTHSDKNYLVKGITLMRSVCETMKEDFRFYYLCLDNETYLALTKLAEDKKFDWLEPVELTQIIKPEALHELKNMPACLYGDQYSQFCWALTPYFTNWLLTNELVKDAELLYCDADLYFYHSPEYIFEACKFHSVGIHRHRFTTYDVDKNPVGEFNVGCVYFKNDKRGKEISSTWKYFLVTPNNEYYQKYGTCGDQKYWDILYPTYPNDIHVFDADDSEIAHGAPWNYNLYKFPSFGSVEHKGKIQRLIFNHFSHFFVIDGGWKSSDHGEWKPEDIDAAVMNYYVNYYEQNIVSQQLVGC